MGIPVGPPDVVDALGIPEPLATRLHNQLHRRGLFTLADARRKQGGLLGALQAALKVDAQIMMQAFIDHEERDPVELEPNGAGE